MRRSFLLIVAIKLFAAGESGFTLPWSLNLLNRLDEETKFVRIRDEASNVEGKRLRHAIRDSRQRATWSP